MKTTGVVIGHESRRSGMEHVLVYPVVRFETADKESIEFESQTGSNAPPKIGAQIEVFYDPTNPSNARIPAASASRFGFMPFYLAGGFILIVGGVMFLIVLAFVTIFLLIALA